MATNNAINLKSAGIVSYNGTGTFTGITLTQYDVLVGGASNTITSIAPSSTSGVPLISSGSAANPAFGTAVVAGGGTGSTTFNANGVVISNTTTTGALSSLALTSGQIVIGGTGAPAAATITAGTGINVVNGNNSITISATGSSGGVTTNVVSTSQTGATNNRYIFASPGGALTISLPTTAAVGDQFIVMLNGATSWQVTQAAGQSVIIGSSTTTVGTGGSLTSTANGDVVRMICSVANTTWIAESVVGNITVV